MDFPLTLPTILERAGKIFGRLEIVSRRPDRSIARSFLWGIYRRARRLGSALMNLDNKTAADGFNNEGNMKHQQGPTALTASWTPGMSVSPA